MAQHTIAIITDSTCDLPSELVEKHGITIIPQVIIWGDRLYRDRVDLQPIDFYQRLAVDPQYPSSSQPGIQDFVDAYVSAASQGAQSIIMLTVSSAMSGTYQLALNAARLVKTPVTVVDSKGPTMTLGWQVLAAARARAAGADVPQILAHVEAVRRQLTQLVAMQSLEYLQKGGRIGGAVKWLGALLQVKPLVAINHQTGLVEPVGLARTHKGLVDLLCTKFFERLAVGNGLHIAVLHGNVPQEAEALAERIRKEYQPVELIINITGPVLGINTGPGALALCGYREE